jgi:3-deoxy-7-phosphoheptulonate synthase
MSPVSDTSPDHPGGSTAGAGAAAQGWTPGSWRSRPAVQQPDWVDEVELEMVVDELRRQPPLVFAGEARNLTAALAQVAAGKAFLLQAGDCAESFEASTADNLRDKLKVILQMAVVLAYSTGVPVVKVGRIAGQFAKPRSTPTETRDGIELPSFRGHIVNDIGFDPKSRAADPHRILQAYFRSAASLNLLRAFTKGGFADLSKVHLWNLEYVKSSPEGTRYDEVADGIESALRFMSACGIDLDTEPQLHEVDFYTSHEALILGYEEALSRRDSLTGDWYDCSAHMLWIGERTRQIDGAHVEFLAGVGNPLGVKLGPTCSTDEALALCERLNPNRVAGRLTLITRMGAERIREALPPLVRAVTDAGHPVVWACDPMHGNTFTSASGYKTRHLDAILEEIRGFFAVHRANGTVPGGVHIELTGEDVTECMGGAENVLSEHLEHRYETMCDPRLNARQSLDLAFRLAAMLRTGS